MASVTQCSMFQTPPPWPLGWALLMSGEAKPTLSSQATVSSPPTKLANAPIVRPIKEPAFAPLTPPPPPLTIPRPEPIQKPMSAPKNALTKMAHNMPSSVGKIANPRKATKTMQTTAPIILPMSYQILLEIQCDHENGIGGTWDHAWPGWRSTQTTQRGQNGFCPDSTHSTAVQKPHFGRTTDRRYPVSSLWAHQAAISASFSSNTFASRRSAPCRSWAIRASSGR